MVGQREYSKKCGRNGRRDRICGLAFDGWNQLAQDTPVINLWVIVCAIPPEMYHFKLSSEEAVHIY